MLIQIKKIGPFSKDERGIAIGFETRPSEYLVILHRKKGTVSGSHYHKGITQSKDPEIFFVVQGRARIIVTDIKSGETEEYIVEPNSMIEIPAFVYHEVHALTDIIFLELDAKKEDFKTDTFYPD